MSLFDILEGRMQQIFERGSAMAPLPFKKLAKRAVREMKRNAVKMDGQTFAPSLYTVLVNPADDAVIAPLYQQVTDELVDFVAHEAQNANLALMANPMVRFISDPNIKPGKTEIVAEVVTPEVVDALRVEEEAYAKNHANLGGRGRRRPGGPDMQGAPRGARPPQAPEESPQRDPRDRRPVPQRRGEEPEGPAAIPGARGQHPQHPARVPAGAPSNAAPAPTARRAAPAGGCELIDKASGRTWRIGVPSTVIGRDETMADLVLNDTNISRKHAELKREGSRWRIVDMGSTNGTRVNGLRVTEYDLSNGDAITLGLITLEFKEL